ncbi:hypothetical protein Pcinc_043929 [Petrolisthes cinctipes]|uniref:Uncharacterized protein n=1 Tax=Petrolisthes cinctipes TaxID=88211 RepID=A0AAE1BF71_PETCI|nr:hypothetical protein Pcinc_043929 [Petrolisthes cinctipes]
MLLWGSSVGGRGIPGPHFPSCSAARVSSVEKFPPPSICKEKREVGKEGRKSYRAACGRDGDARKQMGG